MCAGFAVFNVKTGYIYDINDHINIKITNC